MICRSYTVIHANKHMHASLSPYFYQFIIVIVHSITICKKIYVVLMYSVAYKVFPFTVVLARNCYISDIRAYKETFFFDKLCLQRVCLTLANTCGMGSRPNFYYLTEASKHHYEASKRHTIH